MAKHQTSSWIKLGDREGGRSRNCSLLLRRRSSPDLALQRVCRRLMSPRDVAFYHALAKFSDVLDQPLQDR